MGNDMERADGAFWEQLQQLGWCPVLLAPPHPDMPFATASCPLAPPRMARLVMFPTLSWSSSTLPLQLYSSPPSEKNVMLSL